METATETPAQTLFGQWFRWHKGWWMVIGAAVIVGTYVAEEIAQARFENKIQSVERWGVEARLTERLAEVEPNLRVRSLNWRVALV